MLLAGRLRCLAARGMEMVQGAQCILCCHVPANLCCLWCGQALGCIHSCESLSRPRGGGLLQIFGAGPCKSLSRLQARPFVRMLQHVAASCVWRLVISCCGSLCRRLSAGDVWSRLLLLLPGAPARPRAPAAHAYQGGLLLSCLLLRHTTPFASMSMYLTLISFYVQSLRLGRQPLPATCRTAASLDDIKIPCKQASDNTATTYFCEGSGRVAAHWQRRILGSELSKRQCIALAGQMPLPSC